MHALTSCSRLQFHDVDIFMCILFVSVYNRSDHVLVTGDGHSHRAMVSLMFSRVLPVANVTLVYFLCG